MAWDWWNKLGESINKNPEMFSYAAGEIGTKMAPHLPTAGIGQKLAVQSQYAKRVNELRREKLRWQQEQLARTGDGSPSIVSRLDEPLTPPDEDGVSSVTQRTLPKGKREITTKRIVSGDAQKPSSPPDKNFAPIVDDVGIGVPSGYEPLPGADPAADKILPVDAQQSLADAKFQDLQQRFKAIFEANKLSAEEQRQWDEALSKMPEIVHVGESEDGRVKLLFEDGRTAILDMRPEGFYKDRSDRREAQQRAAREQELRFDAKGNAFVVNGLGEKVPSEQWSLMPDDQEFLDTWRTKDEPDGDDLAKWTKTREKAITSLRKNKPFFTYGSKDGGDGRQISAIHLYNRMSLNLGAAGDKTFLAGIYDDDGKLEDFEMVQLGRDMPWPTFEHIYKNKAQENLSKALIMIRLMEIKEGKRYLRSRGHGESLTSR